MGTRAWRVFPAVVVVVAAAAVACVVDGNVTLFMLSSGKELTECYWSLSTATVAAVVVSASY